MSAGRLVMARCRSAWNRSVAFAVESFMTTGYQARVRRRYRVARPGPNAVARLALFVGFLLAVPVASAREPVTGVAGKSLWEFKLGEPRSLAVSQAAKRWPAAKRLPTRTRPDGTVEDWWTFPYGEFSVWFEASSRKGRVTQLMLQTNAEDYITSSTFADLQKHHTFKESVYDFTDPGGGGYVGFFFDDVARGVCYSIGTQDVFMLTYRPDGIIIHPPNTPVHPTAIATRGRRVTDERARVYKNPEDVERHAPRPD